MISRIDSNEASKAIEDVYRRGKNIFVVYPSSHISPFMDIATKVFSSETEFFEFFPKYLRKRIKSLQRVTTT